MDKRKNIPVTQEQAMTIFDGDDPHYEMVEPGVWSSVTGSYSSIRRIFKHDGGYYRLWVSSDAMGYIYDNCLEPVRQIEVTVKKWVQD